MYNFERHDNVENKRLRKSKVLSSEKMAYVSETAEKYISEEVRKQFIEIMQLPAEYEDMAAKINISGYGILRISRMIKDYCSAVSGKYHTEPDCFDVCELLDFVCMKTAFFTEKENIALIYKNPRRKIFVNINENDFLFAFLNILRNAFENSFSGGRIKISVLKTTKFAKITVCDEGRGMNEETLLHCTEPFFTAKGEKESLGLGLAVTKHFICESEGRLKILSEKGKGTSVLIFIPLADEDEKLTVKASVPEVFSGTFSPVNIVFASAACIKKAEKL